MLLYLAFGIVWILSSDVLTMVMAQSIESIALVQIIKGWCYVLLSAVLIFYLCRQAYIKQQAAAYEKLKAHRTTISGVQHIVFNYLNQMQLVTMEAEKCEDFDPELIELTKKLSKNATEELNKLSEIEEICPEKIESVLYADINKKA